MRRRHDLRKHELESSNRKNIRDFVPALKIPLVPSLSPLESPVRAEKHTHPASALQAYISSISEATSRLKKRVSDDEQQGNNKPNDVADPKAIWEGFDTGIRRLLDSAAARSEALNHVTRIADSSKVDVARARLFQQGLESESAMEQEATELRQAQQAAEEWRNTFAGSLDLRQIRDQAVVARLDRMCDGVKALYMKQRMRHVEDESLLASLFRIEVLKTYAEEKVPVGGVPADWVEALAQVEKTAWKIQQELQTRRAYENDLKAALAARITELAVPVNDKILRSILDKDDKPIVQVPVDLKMTAEDGEQLSQLAIRAHEMSARHGTNPSDELIAMRTALTDLSNENAELRRKLAESERKVREKTHAYNSLKSIYEGFVQEDGCDVEALKQSAMRLGEEVAQERKDHAKTKKQLEKLKQMEDLLQEDAKEALQEADDAKIKLGQLQQREAEASQVQAEQTRAIAALESNVRNLMSQLEEARSFTDIAIQEAKAECALQVRLVKQEAKTLEKRAANAEEERSKFAAVAKDEKDARQMSIRVERSKFDAAMREERSRILSLTETLGQVSLRSEARDRALAEASLTRADVAVQCNTLSATATATATATAPPKMDVSDRAVQTALLTNLVDASIGTEDDDGSLPQERWANRPTAPSLSSTSPRKSPRTNPSGTINFEIPLDTNNNHMTEHSSFRLSNRRQSAPLPLPLPSNSNPFPRTPRMLKSASGTQFRARDGEDRIARVIREMEERQRIENERWEKKKALIRQELSRHYYFQALLSTDDATQYSYSNAGGISSRSLHLGPYKALQPHPSSHLNVSPSSELHLSLGITSSKNIRPALSPRQKPVAPVSSLLSTTTNIDPQPFFLPLRISRIVDDFGSTAMSSRSADIPDPTLDDVDMNTPRHLQPSYGDKRLSSLLSSRNHSNRSSALTLGLGHLSSLFGSSSRTSLADEKDGLENVLRVSSSPAPVYRPPKPPSAARRASVLSESTQQVDAA
mmetsp:Transcript_2446/g.4307  ORF Transcript_2446/g.4307 Transcript_2446/m.4307 type:complete len:991 (+) Transcript_2446:156-3128(+)|eukprot:CAMPEP_0184360600 /NCGR_PEP_ID=MMETSP1089-20130417/125724_1 /TAXON_ID=38269 ORGANISM="Gloeochaete wittrockiana, Strain SAG46.84" /NCGR_SAMPLE_ID=MMETSP1089 /ASSEMBLY_ACC=CAM_ASM_000445 /LENGTH=990 /DNA_ID=CAMNT_0026699843 /DNA_START=83 /DNA_END=3055 /DNA_ORIENTATION=-